MRTQLCELSLAVGGDVVAARQRTRRVASALGFDANDQARISIAASELARQTFALSGRGSLQLVAEHNGTARQLIIRVAAGPGLLHEVKRDHANGEASGVAAAKRLMDSFQTRVTETGVLVEATKLVPQPAPRFDAAELARIRTLVEPEADEPLDELRRQNADLASAMDALRVEQEAVVRLNRELQETNAAVLALYAELEQRAHDLQHVIESKNRFVSAMGHELRTPINAMLALANMLLAGTAPAFAGEQVTQASYIKQSAEALYAIVDELLDLAKAEAGRLEADVSEFTLSHLLGSLRGMCRPLVTTPSVRLQIGSVQRDVLLHTDENKLSQILRNLVSNALKFTTTGAVNVTCRASDGRLRVSVRDTGIGIAEEDLSRIFEEFAQIRNPLQRQHKGTGLGLALSRRLAQLLGGDISVQSSVGRGSTFVLDIPAHLGPATDSAARSGTPAGSGPLVTAALVVDDDPAFRYVATTLLSGTASSVVVACDGAEALRRIAEAPPDVLLLAMRLPDTDGLAVLKRLRAIPRFQHLPIIIVTASPVSPAERQALRALGAVVASKRDLNGPTLARHIRHALTWPERR